MKFGIPPSPPDIYIKALMIQGFFVVCRHPRYQGSTRCLDCWQRLACSGHLALMLDPVHLGIRQMDCRFYIDMIRRNRHNPHAGSAVVQ